MSKLTLDSIVLEAKKSSNRFKPVDKATKRDMKRLANSYKRAVEAGERFVEESSLRFGSTPLPWEPGGDRYFSIAD